MTTVKRQTWAKDEAQQSSIRPWVPAPAVPERKRDAYCLQELCKVIKIEK